MSNFNLKNTAQIILNTEVEQSFIQQTQQLLQELESDGVFLRIQSKGRKEEQKYLVLIQRVMSMRLFDEVGVSPLIGSIDDYTNELYYEHTANFVKAIIYSWDNGIIAPKLRNLFNQQSDSYKEGLNKRFKEDCTIKELQVDEAYFYEIKKLNSGDCLISKDRNFQLPFVLENKPIATSLVDGEIIQDFLADKNRLFTDNLDKLNQLSLSEANSFISNGIVGKNINEWRDKLLEEMFGEYYRPFLSQLKNVILTGRLEGGGN